MVCALLPTAVFFITDCSPAYSGKIVFLPDCHPCLILFFLHSFLNLG